VTDENYELSDDARRILGAERANERRVDIDRIERLGARLEATLPAGAFAVLHPSMTSGTGTPGTSSPAVPSAGGSAKLVFRAKIGAALVAAAAAGAAGEHVRLEARATPPPASAPSAIVTSSSSAVVTPSDLPSAPIPSAAPQLQASAPAIRPAAPPSAATADSVARDQALHEERTLLDRARSALARGDGASALDALRESETKHPKGSLAEEREAYFILAFVRAGEREHAEQRARAFRSRHPNSIFIPTIDDALAGTP
jgi:hypothetical protein